MDFTKLRLVDSNYIINNKFDLKPRFNFAIRIINSDLKCIGEFKDILVKSVKVPVYKIETDSKNVGNYNIKVLTNKTNSFEFEIVFFNESNNFAENLYYEWLSKMVFRNNLLNYPSKYERDIEIQIFDMKYILISHYRLYRCYPIQMTEDNFDKNDKDYLLEKTITFVCNGGINFILI